MTLDALLREVTRRALLRALRVSGGHRALAAQALGVPQRRLERLLASHVTPDELATQAIRHGWPTRPQLAAYARAHRAARR